MKEAALDRPKTDRCGRAEGSWWYRAYAREQMPQGRGQYEFSRRSRPGPSMPPVARSRAGGAVGLAHRDAPALRIVGSLKFAQSSMPCRVTFVHADLRIRSHPTLCRLGINRCRHSGGLPWGCPRSLFARISGHFLLRRFSREIHSPSTRACRAAAEFRRGFGENLTFLIDLPKYPGKPLSMRVLAVSRNLIFS